MIDHVSIGVRDIARSKRFYDAALKPLGCLPEPGRGIARLRARYRRALDRRYGASRCRRHDIWFALLLHRADARQRQCIPCRRAENRRARQREARPARRLQLRLLCGLCHRPRRLPDRGALPVIAGVGAGWRARMDTKVLTRKARQI
jgi:hypothetical protein